mmetsp:Transcript_9903/g.24506  ORF Transcript_9903/g.24506 Transcript_9903/m.24506 type:complete len:210 (+) Transcript_9903:559-1188(+)
MILKTGRGPIFSDSSIDHSKASRQRHFQWRSSASAVSWSILRSTSLADVDVVGLEVLHLRKDHFLEQATVHGVLQTRHCHTVHKQQKVVHRLQKELARIAELRRRHHLPGVGNVGTLGLLRSRTDAVADTDRQQHDREHDHGETHKVELRGSLQLGLEAVPRHVRQPGRVIVETLRDRVLVRVGRDCIFDVCVRMQSANVQRMRRGYLP